MAILDPYRTLMVHPAADADIIRVVYRKLAQRYHPDVADDPEAARRMAELNAARDLLLDPARRAAYDGALAKRGAGSAAAGAQEAAEGPPSAEPGSTAKRGAPEPTAGPPPGQPSGPVLRFGRYAGWSLGEIARQDTEYIEWLDRMPIGRPFRAEIDALLRAAGRRGAPEARARASARRG